MNFIRTLQIIAQVLPAVIELMKIAETLIPEGGKGKEKLAYVKDMLESTYNSLDAFGVTFVELWAKLEPVIAATVKLLNSTGVFKKK